MSRAKKIMDDISAISKKRLTAKSKLGTAKERSEIEAGTSEGYATTDGGSGTSGAAFPFTEEADSRVYYANRYISSTDGIFQIAYTPIKNTKFKDNSGSVGQVNYVDPDG
jgi:hypothetical protein